MRLLANQDTSIRYELSDSFHTSTFPHTVLGAMALDKSEGVLIRKEMDIAYLVRAPHVITLKIPILDRSRIIDEDGFYVPSHFSPRTMLRGDGGRALIRGRDLH